MFDLGDTVPLGVEIRDDAGALTDAASVVLTITLPDGTTATPTVTHSSTGVYTCLYVPATAGRYLARWTSTGPSTAHTDTFDVDAAAPLLIVGLDEAKAWLNVATTDTTFSDEKLRAVIGAVTAAVEKRVGPVVRRSVTTTVNRVDACEYALPHYPVVSVTSAAYVSDDSAIDVSTWYVDDYGILRTTDLAALPTSPYTVTYVVGRPDLPANIRVGALEVIKRLYRTQRAKTNDDFLPFLVANYVAEMFASDEQPGFA